MRKHIVQTEIWKDFKNEYGTKAISAGGVIYTKHKLPLINKYYAYCPRVNPAEVDFDALKKSLLENECVGLTFDVPNIVKGSEEENDAIAVMEKYCKKSKRSEFAKGNVILDLKPSEEELFKNMHKKHRYNTRYAARSGIEVEMASDLSGFEEFYKLLKLTSMEQKFFIRPKKYYQKVWEVLSAQDKCFILTAKFQNEALASWMIFIQDGILYYPYGGSSQNYKNFFPSNALGWEVIRFGKEKGCDLFDMWGASENPEDEKDSYHGFTTFKLRFGGRHVKYISSYDLVINKLLYFLFTSMNNIRWSLLEAGLVK